MPAGSFFEDTIEIGGIVIQNQAVEAATQLSTNNVDEPFDGILGLSLSPSTITPPVNTTLYNLLSHPLQLPVFTCALYRPTEQDPGFFTFGEIDQQLIGDQSVEFTDVIPFSQNNPDGYWLFSSSYAKVNGVVIPRAGNLAIADTGTPVILLANSTLSVIYGQMGGIFVQNLTGPYGSAWIYPETAYLPNITLPIGNVEITLAQNDINGGASPIDGYVYGTLQPRELQGLEWDIFGDVWFWNVYAIFNLSDPNAPSLGAVQRAAP